jgi:hypothetical protein
VVTLSDFKRLLTRSGPAWPLWARENLSKGAKVLEPQLQLDTDANKVPGAICFWLAAWTFGSINDRPWMLQTAQTAITATEPKRYASKYWDAR